MTRLPSDYTVSQPIWPEYDISFRRLVRNSRVGSVEVDRSLMAPLCAGSLLVARRVSGVIHENLKEQMCLQKESFPLKKCDFMSFIQYIDFRRVRNIAKRGY